jgi:hypothetical protein
MKLLSYVSVLAVIIMCSFSVKQNTKKVKDYLSVPGPVSFDNSTYNLSWSSHPSANYYKQEYLRSNEKAETFTRMLIIEALNTDMALKDVVKAKTNELQQRKGSDAVTNYQVIENKSKSEYLLDFVISESAGNKMSVVEWNAYRYVNLNAGGKGVLLFAYSRRAYGDNVSTFLTSLKTERVKDVKYLAAYKIPGVKISE